MGGERHNLRLLAEIYSFVALASLWNLLAGYAGLVSVGQQAYVGLGAYVLFAACSCWSACIRCWRSRLRALSAPSSRCRSPALIFRLRGNWIAIGTWVVAEVFRLLASQVSVLGGGSGISLPVGIVTSLAPTRQLREFLIYWLALAIVVAVLGAIVLLLRSSLWPCAHGDPRPSWAARSNGVDVVRTEAHRLSADRVRHRHGGRADLPAEAACLPRPPPSTSTIWTAYVIFITVIGGIGRVEGPIIGTIVFFLLRHALADLGSLYLLMLGVVAIAVMLKVPKGIWGYIADRFGWQLFPLARRLNIQT